MRKPIAAPGADDRRGLAEYYRRIGDGGLTMAGVTLTYPQRQRREPARSNRVIYTSILALLAVLIASRSEVVPAAQAGARWSEQLYQGSVSAAVAATMTTVAAMGCGVSGSALGVVPGIAGAVVCGSVAAYYAPPVGEWLIITLTPDQQLDELSILAGSIGGSILGAYGAAAVVGRLWLGNFAAYSRSVRLATERTYKMARERIDPYDLRGLLAGYDLDHALSVGCGYLLGVPPSIMASGWNLQMLPSSENRSLRSACR